MSRGGFLSLGRARPPRNERTRKEIGGGFRYMAEPLCMVACALYAANRWLVKPHVASPFLRGHFDDLLMIPCALPLVLWIQRRLGLREHDRFPSWREVAGHLLVWTLIAEALGPRWLHRGVGDPRDALAYALGAVAAGVVWMRQSAKPRRAAQ